MDGHSLRNVRGASLIELAITMAIVAVVVSLGLPSFREWIQNSRIRTTAESVSSGLQIARNEAVRRNTNIQFVLIAPGTSGGTGWQVSAINTGEVVQTGAAEGGGGVVITPTPEGSYAVTFNGYGRTPISGLNTDGTALISQLDFDSTAIDASETRELRLFVTTGGQIRMCDPSVTNERDTRIC